MKPISFFAILFCMFFSFCNPNIASRANENNAGKPCKDSLTAYKRVVIGGAQQTDLGGNRIHNTQLHYRIYLLSDSQEIVIDSLEIGKKRIKGLDYALVKAPLYWDGTNEKMLLVPETGCFVYQVIASYHTNEQLQEEEQNHISLHYSKNGLQKSLLVKQVTLLPQMVTE